MSVLLLHGDTEHAYALPCLSALSVVSLNTSPLQVYLSTPLTQIWASPSLLGSSSPDRRRASCSRRERDCTQEERWRERNMHLKYLKQNYNVKEASSNWLETRVASSAILGNIFIWLLATVGRSWEFSAAGICLIPGCSSDNERKMLPCPSDGAEAKSLSCSLRLAKVKGKENPDCLPILLLPGRQDVVLLLYSDLHA